MILVLVCSKYNFTLGFGPRFGPGFGRPRRTVRTPGPPGRRTGSGRFEGTIIPTSF